MGASVTARNQALNALDATGTPSNLIGFTSLHTADPGTTGASEAIGGGYARQACAWNAAASGAKTNSSALTFSTTGATANTHFAGQSASTGGTFGLGGPLAASVTAPTVTVAAGALTLTVA